MPRYQHALRSRILRDDVAVDPLLAPPADVADPAVAGVVSAVETVQPMTKRYRATVSRTITETALVEFDAPETADLYTMAEALLPQIPDDAWVQAPDQSWGYIDRIEAVEAVADPAAPDAMLEDSTMDGEDPEQPDATAGRSGRGVRIVAYRRNPGARHVRMTADEATSSTQSIVDRANAVVTIAPATADEAAQMLSDIEALAAELDTLMASTFDGTDPEAEAAAYEAMVIADQTITDIYSEVESQKMALETAESITGDPALEPVL